MVTRYDYDRVDDARRLDASAGRGGDLSVFRGRKVGQVRISDC